MKIPCKFLVAKLSSFQQFLVFDNEMQRNRLASEALLRRINEATKTLHELDSAYRLAENDLGHREELSRQNADRLTALGRA